MGSDVRTTPGVPPLSAFASGEGTPLVIDEATGMGYFAKKNTVVPLISGSGVNTPSFAAGVPVMTQSFANNVAAKVTGFTTQSETPDSGFNPTTGDFTVPVTGWYSFTAWASVGMTPANLISVVINFGASGVIPLAVSDNNVAPARGYITTCPATVLKLNAGSVVNMRVQVQWGDAGSHPFTDGALVFNGAFLHP
jgi:hypothetical protein